MQYLKNNEVFITNGHQLSKNMNIRIRNIIAVLVALAGSANAQTLSVQSIEAEAGSQANIFVSISGVEANTTALQFNLALPDGVTLNETGISTGTAASNHGYEVRSLDSGERLIVVFDLNLGSIQNGELLILPVTLGTAEGTFSGSLSTVRFSDTDAVSKEEDGTSFTITAKRPEQPVTITANNLTMVYGDDVPELTYKTEGATLEGTPSLTTTATKTSAVGTYPINVGIGSVTNTKTTYVAGTLTITKAPLTVGVKNETITEGDAIPAFKLTYNGFRNSDTEATAFTTKPAAKTTATPSSPAGTYPITVSGGEAQNYALTYGQGTLTIDEKETDGIGSVKANDQPDAPIYNLAGQKVNARYKGIAIRNGKKVILR